MTLLTLVMVLVVLGLAWWILTQVIPMPGPGKTVVSVIFVIILLLIVMQLFGIGDFRVGR